MGKAVGNPDERSKHNEAFTLVIPSISWFSFFIQIELQREAHDPIVAVCPLPERLEGRPNWPERGMAAGPRGDAMATGSYSAHAIAQVENGGGPWGWSLDAKKNVDVPECRRAVLGQVSGEYFYANAHCHAMGRVKG